MSSPFRNPWVSGGVAKLPITQGLPAWADIPGHPNLVISAGLRDSTLTDNGIGVWGDAQSGGQDFDSAEGMDPATNQGIRFRISVNAAGSEVPLETTGGFLRMGLTVGINTGNGPATNEKIFSISGGNMEWRITSGLIRNLLHGVGELLTVNPDSRLNLTDSHYIFAVNWDGTWSDVYIDGLLMSRTAQTVEQWANFYLAANTTGTGNWGGERVRDFALLDAPQIFPVAESLLFLGDSYVVGGAGPQAMSQVPVAAGAEVLPWATTTSGGAAGVNYGVGFDSNDDYSSFTTKQDQAYVPTCIRELGRFNIFTEGNGHYGKNGNQSSATPDMIDRAITGGIRPTISLLIIGANDNIQAVTAADYDTRLKAILTKLHNETTTKTVVLSRIISIANDPAFSGAAFTTRTEEYLAVIDALPAWVLTQGWGREFLVIADCYNVFGGPSPDTSLFVSGDIHPNSLGSNVMGKTMIKALIDARSTL